MILTILMKKIILLPFMINLKKKRDSAKNTAVIYIHVIYQVKTKNNVIEWFA